MRITVDIEEGVLDDLVKLTGETKRSPAVAKAVGEYVRRQKLKEFGRLIRQGAFDDAFPAGYDPDKPGLLAAEDPASFGSAPAQPITPPADGPR
jgi:hypothetical protein